MSLVFLQTVKTLMFAKRRHSLDHAQRKSFNSFDQTNELASQSLHPTLPFSSLRDEVRGCEKYVRAVSYIRACIWSFQSSCRTEIGTPSHNSPQPCRSIYGVRQCCCSFNLYGSLPMSRAAHSCLADLATIATASVNRPVSRRHARSGGIISHSHRHSSLCRIVRLH